MHLTLRCASPNDTPHTCSGVRSAAGPAHPCTQRAVALPQTRMGAWSGLRCVRSGLGIDAEHAHRDQRRASRASRNDAHAHACPGPPRANFIDRRTQRTAPASVQVAVLCHHACVQPRIHHACEDVAFNVVHARARRGARSMQQNGQQGEHAGQGGAGLWQRPGRDQSGWAPRGRGRAAVVRHQLEVSQCCTSWSSAVRCKTWRKDRGAAGLTLAGLRSTPTKTVEGAGHGQG